MRKRLVDSWRTVKNAEPPLGRNSLIRGSANREVSNVVRSQTKRDPPNDFPGRKKEEQHDCTVVDGKAQPNEYVEMLPTATKYRPDENAVPPSEVTRNRPVPAPRTVVHSFQAQESEKSSDEYSSETEGTERNSDNDNEEESSPHLKDDEEQLNDVEVQELDEENWDDDDDDEEADSR